MLLIGLLSLLLAIALSSSEKEGINFSSLSVIRITSLLLLFSSYLSYNSNYLYNLGNGIGVYGGLFQISYLSQNLDIFLYLIGGLILLIGTINIFSLSYKENNKLLMNNGLSNNLTESSVVMTSEYAYIAIFSIIGGSLLMMSKDLISMYISIELQSFALYLLATIYRNYDKASRGGLKYFLLGGLSSTFILLGIGIIYRVTGLTDLDYISILYNEGNLTKSLDIGILIILVGLLFKISAAPFHN
jgi:NADH-ubiquinone oxidoreductase chain 2